MQPEMTYDMYNEYVTGERDYYSEQEQREWMFAEYYNEDNIVDIEDNDGE